MKKENRQNKRMQTKWKEVKQGRGAEEIVGGG